MLTSFYEQAFYDFSAFVFFFFLFFRFILFFFLKEGSINILQNNEWKRNIRWNTEKLVRSRRLIDILSKSEIYVIIVETVEDIYRSNLNRSI